LKQTLKQTWQNKLHKTNFEISQQQKSAKPRISRDVQAKLGNKLGKTKISQTGKSANYKNQPRQKSAKRSSGKISQQQKSAKPRISRDVQTTPGKTNLQTNLVNKLGKTKIRQQQKSANNKNQPTRISQNKNQPTKISQLQKSAKRSSGETWHHKFDKTNLQTNLVRQKSANENQPTEIRQFKNQPNIKLSQAKNLKRRSSETWKQTWQNKNQPNTKISQLQKSANKNQPTTKISQIQNSAKTKNGKTNLARQSSQDITQPTKIRQQKSAKTKISQEKFW